MKRLEILGLNEKQVEPVIVELQQLLANLQVYYTNLRGLHWNIVGKRFFQMHAKYEELYNDTAEKVDEVAERILQLGATPENRYSQYLKVATLQENTGIMSGKDGVKNILETLTVLIAQERKISALADEAGDNVTVGLMDGYLQSQEKLVWMLTAFLTKKEDK